MNKNLIASIIVALGFALLFILVLPEYDAVKSDKAVLQARQELLNERTAEVKNFKDLEREADARQSEIGKITTFVPPKKQIDEVVSSIQRMTSDSGLQLVSLAAAAVTDNAETRYRKLFINVEAVSQYPAFINFLRSLEQSLRLYDVSDIAAGVSSGGLGAGVNFSIKIYGYYLK